MNERIDKFLQALVALCYEYQIVLYTPEEESCISLGELRESGGGVTLESIGPDGWKPY